MSCIQDHVKEFDFNPKDFSIESLLARFEEEGNMFRILKGHEGHALSGLMEQSFEVRVGEHDDVDLGAALRR